jgi:hypothetical protein
MLIFGCLVLYGGLGVCLWIAWRNHRSEESSAKRRD